MLNTHTHTNQTKKCPKVIRCSAPFRVRITRAPEISCVLVALVASAFSDSAARGAAQSHGCSLEHLELDHWTVKYPMDIQWINGI